MGVSGQVVLATDTSGSGCLGTRWSVRLAVVTTAATVPRTSGGPIARQPLKLKGSRGTNLPGVGSIDSAGVAEAEKEGSRWGKGESQTVSHPGQKARARDSCCAHQARERSASGSSAESRVSGPVEWKELCRAPEGEQGKGGQERVKKRGMNSKSEESGDGRESQEASHKAESMALFPSLTNQITQQIMTRFREVNKFYVQDRVGGIKREKEQKLFWGGTALST